MRPLICFCIINQGYRWYIFEPIESYLEITAVFKGIFVDTYIKLFLDKIVAHGPEREVGQMGFGDGKVDVRKEGEEFSFGHHSAGKGDFQPLDGLTSR